MKITTIITVKEMRLKTFVEIYGDQNFQIYTCKQCFIDYYVYTVKHLLLCGICQALFDYLCLLKEFNAKQLQM